MDRHLKFSPMPPKNLTLKKVNRVSSLKITTIIDKKKPIKDYNYCKESEIYY